LCVVVPGKFIAGGFRYGRGIDNMRGYEIFDYNQVKQKFSLRRKALFSLLQKGKKRQVIQFND